MINRLCLEMEGQLFLADSSPAFGTRPDEESGAFPVNQVYDKRFVSRKLKCCLAILAPDEL